MRALVLLALLAACGSSGPVKIDKGVRLEYSLDLDAVKDRGAAVADAVRIIKQRIARGRVKATAFARGEHVFIDLAAGDPEDMARARDLFARVGRFEVKLVDSGDELMQRLYTVAKQDPGAPDVMIDADKDQWTIPDGAPHDDWYLTSVDRRRLAAYVDGLRHRDPALAIPDDRQLGYQLVEARLDYSRRQFWRTYLLERTIVLSNRDIAEARPFDDPETRQPSVRVDLADAPARAFGELTGKLVGQKLAFIVDDRVVSAPIIASAIDRGRISFAIDEPKLVAIVIATGPLPAAMREETATEIDGDKLRYMDAEGNMVTVPR